MTYVIFGLVALAIAALVVVLIMHFRTGAGKDPLMFGPTPSMVQLALQVVWVETYIMFADTAPKLMWVVGDRLNCRNGTGWTLSDGTCAAGNSWQDINTSAVAWPPGTKNISDTAFAHELCHALRWHQGTPDPDHTGPDFAPGGLVEQANKALRARGL